MFPAFFFSAFPANTDVVTTSTATAASLRKFIDPPVFYGFDQWTAPCGPLEFTEKKREPEGSLFPRCNVQRLVLEADSDLVTTRTLERRRPLERSREAVRAGALVRIHEEGAGRIGDGAGAGV